MFSKTLSPWLFLGRAIEDSNIQPMFRLFRWLPKELASVSPVSEHGKTQHTPDV